jgi:biopolymer transport protein ExbD
MDIMLYVLGAVAVAVFVLWFVLGDKEEVAVQLPSSDELKKLKKAELVELAASKNIFVDIKSTKAVIIKEMESSR